MNEIPDTDVARVGVYVCHCGGNISDVVDTAAVADAAAKNPMVAIARHYAFMCSDPGQQMIIDDIKETGVNRVVVAACSPFLHDLTFRSALQRAGLNPYLYENVNLREQVSWVHKGDKAAATEKAIRLTNAGIQRVFRQDPLESIRVDAEPQVVVIGGGIAGLRSALSCASNGLKVTVVEVSDSLGGRLSELGKVYPSGDDAADLIRQMVDAVQSDDRITVLLSSEVAAIDGYVGNFTVRVQAAGTKPGGLTLQKTVRAGAIIFATGFDHYKPRDGEMGYGNENVVTLPEFNALLADAAGKTLTRNGREIRSVAVVHCIGSRQVEGVHEPGPDGKVNEYCSRVCCTSALDAINRALDRFPNLRVYDLYKDIRTYGRGHEDIYERTSKRGALFFRFADDDQPTFKANGNGAELTLKDVLTWNEEVEIQADLVVLATGMVPRNIDSLVEMLKLPRGTDRFLQEVHPKLRPVELANNGVFIAGTCQGPMDITESCSAAEAAAVKAAILLSKPTIELDPFVARVDFAKCTGCNDCLGECEYKGALETFEENGRPLVRVNPALCSGCGACVAVCEPRAISIAGWSLDQFDAMIDAFVADMTEVTAV